MSDARWGDPRDALMHDLDLPRGEERELVVDRDRVYELNGEDRCYICREFRELFALKRSVRRAIDRL
jgi:hypothetical protein